MLTFAGPDSVQETTASHAARAEESDVLRLSHASAMEVPPVSKSQRQPHLAGWVGPWVKLESGKRLAAIPNSLVIPNLCEHNHGTTCSLLQGQILFKKQLRLMRQGLRNQMF